MRKILLVLLSFFVIALIPTSVYAEEGDSMSDTNTDSAVETTTTLNDISSKPVKARPAVTTLMKDKMMETTDAMKEKKMEARNMFKEKLQSIKDTKKQNILENLDTRINDSNKKRTTQMSERLVRLSSILTKISEMATTLESEGKSVTSLNALITAANTAIEDAKTAVSDQAAKDYTIDITSESALKTSAKAAIKEYIDDIKTTFEKVLAAHKAVAKAFESAKSLKGESVSPTVTPSE